MHFCCGYMYISLCAHARKESEEMYGYHLLQTYQLFCQHVEYRQRRLWNVSDRLALHKTHW